jgi:hypothetical protein
VRVLTVRAQALEAAFGTPVLQGQAGVLVGLRGRFERDGIRAAAFIVGIRFDALTPEGGKGEPELLIHVERLLVYSHLPEATDAELLAFAQRTALLTAWPMLRADVLDLSVRLGINPILLPLLKLGPNAVPEAVAATPSTSRESTAGKAATRPGKRARGRPAAGR